MAELVLLPSAVSKTAHAARGVDAHPSSAATVPSPPPSSALAEMPQDASARSMGNFAPAFTVSSFNSGLPLTLRDSSSSGGYTPSHPNQPFVMANSSTQLNTTPHQGSSSGGSVSASAEQRSLYHTPPPPLRPLSSEVAVDFMAEDTKHASLSVRGQTQQVTATRSTTTGASTTTTLVMRPLSQALASLTNASLPMVAMEEEAQQTQTQSTSPRSPPLFVDTASMVNPPSGAGGGVANETAARSRETAMRFAPQRPSAQLPQLSSPRPPSPTSPPAPATSSLPAELTWVDYGVYVSLATPVVPQRSLQDRLAQLCCPSTTSADGRSGHLVCLDSVLPFLLHGRAITPPVTTSASSASRLSPSSSAEAQRMCFPLFCLAGAKLCSLSAHTRAIRSIHTPMPPMTAAAAMRPQAVNGSAMGRVEASAAASRADKKSGRLHVLLLFTEQLVNAFPGYPLELLHTTSPSGAVVIAPAPETALTSTAMCRSWQSTPREVRQTTPYDALWGVITLQRFAVLLQRWGVSPAEAMQRLHTVTTTAAVQQSQPHDTAELSCPAVPRQLMLLPTTELSSCVSTESPQIATQQATAAPSTRDAGFTTTATTDSPSLNDVRPHLPYPPSTRQRQQQQQHGAESNSVSSDTAASSNSWEYAAIRGAGPTHGGGTPATAAAMRTSATRSRRHRHDAAFGNSSLGTPLTSDDAEDADRCEAGHPYNASVTAASAVLVDGGKGTPYGHLHRYDVPSPPSPAAARNENGASFLRTFTRSGGVVPAAMSSSPGCYEAWNARKVRCGTSAYVPSPPKVQPQQPQRQQQLHRHHTSHALLAAQAERRRHNDVVTPLPPRPDTAEGQRRLMLLNTTRSPAMHPYNVSGRVAGASASKRHKKSHKHSRSSGRHGHSGESTCAAVAEQQKRMVDPTAGPSTTSALVSPAGTASTEANAPTTLSTTGNQSDTPAGTAQSANNGSDSCNARKRTGQVNAYVQQLITSAAEARRRNETVAYAQNPQRRSGGSGESIDANSLEVDLHAYSGRSNTSANANSLNGGRIAKSVAGAGAALTHAPSEVTGDVHQRVSTGVQHVPVPPPPLPLSQSRRSNPHASLLQSWESSTVSPSDSGWRAAVESAGSAGLPARWSLAASDEQEKEKEDVAVPRLSSSMQQAREEMVRLVDGAALIPSAASSQSQLSMTSPCSSGVQRAGAVSASPSTLSGGLGGDTVPLSQPRPFPSAIVGADLSCTLNGVSAADRAVWVVSHTPEHGLVVTSLQLPVSAHGTSRSAGDVVPAGGVLDTSAGGVVDAVLPSPASKPCSMASAEVVSGVEATEKQEGLQAVASAASAEKMRAASTSAASVTVSPKCEAIAGSAAELRSSPSRSASLPEQEGRELPFVTSVVSTLSPLHLPINVSCCGDPLHESPNERDANKITLLEEKTGVEQHIPPATLPTLTPIEEPAVPLSYAPPRLGIAAQLRALIAPVMQAVGRGYLARLQLSAKAALQNHWQGLNRLEERMGLADSVLTSTGLAAAALQPHPPSAEVAGVSAAAVSPPVPPAQAPDTKPPRKNRPPPLTAFAAPEAAGGLRSPVAHGSLLAAGTSAQTRAGETKANESSCLSAARSSSLKEPHSVIYSGLNRSSSQSSATSSQHPSTVSPTQQLFSIYGVPSYSAMENSGASWMPPVLTQGASATVSATSYNESGVLDGRPTRVVRVVEQSLDTSRISSLSTLWAKEGVRGKRDGMASTHTLPPPKEERQSGSSRESVKGEKEGSGSQQLKQRDVTHSAASIVVSPAVGGAEAVLPPSLMKPIIIPARDRPTEDATSLILRDSTEDWLNLLHSRLGAGGSCTVAFVGQKPNGPTQGSVNSGCQDSTSSHSHTGTVPRRLSNSMDSTRAMHSAMCMLRLQRLGRGYLTRLQLAQRYRDEREEDDLDALLKDVLLLHNPPSPPPTAADAAAAAEDASGPYAGAGNAFDGGRADEWLPGAAMGLSSGMPSSTPSPQSPAVSATPPGTTSGKPGGLPTSPPAALLGPPLTPFQVPAEGFAPSTRSSASANAAEGFSEQASLTASTASASKIAGDATAWRVRGSSPFVTPDTSHSLVPPAFLPPSAFDGARRPSHSQEFPRSNSFSLSREAVYNGAPGGGGGGALGAGSVGAAMRVASGNTRMSGSGAGEVETSSLPVSASRRCSVVSPPSMRVSFSREAYTPTMMHSEAAFPVVSAASGLNGPAVTCASVAAEMPFASLPRAKLVEGVHGAFLSARSPSPSSPEGAAAVPPVLLPPADTTALVEVVTVEVAAATSVLGELVEDEEEVVVETPVGPIPCWKATSAAAGANTSPMEGSIFAVSGRSGRSMISASSLPFDFSTTAHAVSAMSHGELMFSGRTMGSMTPAQWALDGVGMVDSTSHFDDIESASEDNNEDSRGSSDSDEDGDEGHSSDEEANEADAFKRDITHVEDGGAEPACFGAAAHILRGERAVITNESALSLLQRVGRGYLCRRHQHFLFMVSISFAEVALLQRVAVAFLTRRRMGLEFHVNRLVREEMAHWELRNRAAIKLHAVVRGFMARQRVKRRQRKLFTRIELRTALELPDPDE